MFVYQVVPMMPFPTACQFCKKQGSLAIERNAETNRLLLGCLHCGYWWSAPAPDILERRRPIADGRKASGTSRRNRK